MMNTTGQIIHLTEIKEKAQLLAGLPNVVRSASAIAIALAKMIEEPHDGAECYSNGRLSYNQTQGQFDFYATVLGLWLTGGVGGCEPYWTSYPTLRLDDFPKLAGIRSELLAVAGWAMENDHKIRGWRQ